MAERIVVIGSNSFTGATFVAAALGEGVEVLGLSRSPEPIPAFLPYRWIDEAARQRFTFRSLDLNQHIFQILDAINDFHPDYVVNFAAQSMVAESWLNPEHWYQTNVIANVRLHEGLRKFGWLRKYVHVSTPEVYGSCSGEVREDARFNPSTPYAASRAACDLHLQTFFKRYDFPVVFTRAANVYGPGQQLYRIIPRTVLYGRVGRRLPLHGGGHSVRSFIHARDVSEATLAIARKGVPGEAYHLSTALHISIRELVGKLCAKLGVEFTALAEVTDDRPGKDAAYLLNSDKARNELGWTDHVTLDQGLDETIAWVDRHLADLKQQPFDYIHKP